MHWLLASLLVLPPRTGPLPLVGLKRDARRTELVFQVHGVFAAGVLLTSRHPRLRAEGRPAGAAERDLPFSPYGHRNPSPD